MDYWFMPSPSASDGGSDNTSVAAAAVWMRTLAGMLLPMLSTAAAAGQGSQVAAQDQRALQTGADCLSSAAGTRPGTQTRVRARPAQTHPPPLQRGRVSFIHRRNHQKSFQLNNWAAHACFALSYSGSHDVVTMRMHMRMHKCRAGAHIWLSYEKNSIIIVQTSHHTRHKSMILRPMMITKGRDITGVNITAYA
jgi:hypothetical protein